MNHYRRAFTFTSPLLRRLPFCALLLSLLVAKAAAQSATDGSTPSALSPGSPAGSYALSDFDTVNLYNGSVNFSLPLLRVGGRGAAGYPITLQIQKKWRVEKHLEPGVGAFYYPEPDWWSEDDYGWRVFDVGRLQIRRGHSEQFDLRCNWYIWRETLTRVTFTAPDGTEYEMRDQKTNGQYLFPPCDSNGGYNRGKVFVTSDGTSATFISDTDVRDAYKTDEVELTHPKPSGYMLLKDGTRFRVQDGTIKWMRDRNGNQVTFTFDSFKRVTGVTDSLGRDVTIVYPSGSIKYTEIGFRGFGGRPRTIRVGESPLSGALRGTLTLQNETGPGGLFPELNASGGVNGNQVVVSYVELPDGRKYEFEYNTYAELARVVLPTGGAVEYDYAAGLADGPASGVFNVTGASGTVINKFIYRRVVERRVYPDGGTGAAYASKIVYSRPETLTTNSGYVVTEQCTPTAGESIGLCGTGAALLSREHHFFYGSPRASFSQLPTRYGSWKEGKEYKTEIYHPQTNALLRSVDNLWQQPAAGTTWPLGTAESDDNARPNSPQLTQTQTTLSDTGQASKQTFAYDRFSNRTDAYEYDYGTTTGVAAQWTRRTSTTYVSTNATGGTTYDYACDPTTTCHNDHINKDVIHQRSLPNRQSVYDAAGTELSRTTYEYDDYDATDDPAPAEGKHAALVPRGNITGLCTTYDAQGVCANAAPASFKTRGNVTAVTTHLLTGGAVNGAYSAFSQYDVAGSVVKNIDARGKSSTVTYADSFCNDGIRCGHTFNLNTYAFAASNSSPVPDPSGQYGSTAPLVRATVYDFWTGLPYSTTDANNQTTVFEYEDGLNQLDRIKAAARPDGGRTEFNYGDAVGNLFVQTLTDLDGARKMESKQYFDGLGRVYRTATYENAVAAEPWLNVDTQYDALGRVVKASMPFRSNRGGLPLTPDDWSGLKRTETEYDALGRVKKVTTRPDGAVAQNDYKGARVLFTDQFGAQKISRTDALGRLTDVWEVATSNQTQYPGVESLPTAVIQGLPASAAHGYHTEYFYDTLGNLRRVKQDTQQRFFAYDSLGRLVRVKNPEQGNFTPDAAGGDFPALDDTTSGELNDDWSVGYVYDANGNVLKRKDARGVVTAYGYDALNRNTTVGYTIPSLSGVAATPNAYRYYDNATAGANGLGRLHRVAQGGTTTSATYFDQYDAAGRPLAMRQRFETNSAWSADYTVESEYNLAGGLTRLTYPSGNSVEYQYDPMGRPGDQGSLPAFKGTLGGGAEQTYASQVLYDEVGGMSQERFGTDTPLYNKRFYNSRGQLGEIRVSTHGLSAAGQGTNWNRGAIINHYGGSDNNGNLRRQDLWVPKTDGAGYDQGDNFELMTQDFDYDALNRLTRAAETWEGQTRWAQAYDYDRWGSRTLNAEGTWLGQTTAPPSDSINEKQFDKGDLPNTNRLYAPGDLAIQNMAQRRMRYDAAGNLAHDEYTGAGTRSYDAENRMTSAGFDAGQAQTASYAYDGDGRRVRRAAGTGDAAWQVYGAGGELLAEYAPGAAPSQPQKEYGYRGGELLVTASAPGSSGSTGVSTEPVAWTNVVGASASASTLTKTAGAGWGNAGASSTQSITSGDGYLEFTASQAYVERICGLSRGDADQGHADVDFGILLSDGGYIYAWESGVQKVNAGAYAVGDVLRVAVVGGAVKYYKNGALFYTSASAPTYPLLADAAINTAGASLSGVVISGNLTSAASWENTAGVTAAGGSLTKTAANGWGNAGASSAQTVASGGVSVEFTATADRTDRACGLGQVQAPRNLSDIGFGILLSDGGYVYAVEGGTIKTNAGAYATGDRLRVSVEGGAVKYYRNGTLFYTSMLTPSYPLRAGAALNQQGAGLGEATLLVAAAGAGGADVRWLVTDHLGTPRMVLDKTGSLAKVSRHDYLPFGEELSSEAAGPGALRTDALGYKQDAVRQKFTGYERDEETKLDYAQARYYANLQGRFTGVDPLLASGRAGAPQTWNRYAYALNNPLKYTDPTGMDVALEGTEQTDYINSFNSRRGKKFTVANKGNMVRIINEKGDAMGKAALKALGATLTGGEKELFDAITDEKTHATIDTGNGQPNDEVLFGRADMTYRNGPAGRNTLDMSEIKLLDAPENKGGLTSADAVAHETLEAYKTAGGMSPTEAHAHAGKYFGQFAGAGNWDFTGQPDPFNGKYSTGTLDFNVVKAGGAKATMRADVNFTFGATPNAMRVPYFNVTKVRIVP